MNDFDYNNEIVDVTEEDTKKEESKTEEFNPEDLVFGESEKKPKKEKKKLSKKSKIIIICGVVGVLLIASIVTVYFVFLKKDKPDTPKKPDEIFSEDNYRYENGTLMFLNTMDKVVGRYECTNKDSKLCMVANVDLSEDTFDREKSVFKNGQEIFKNSKIYLDKYVFIKDGEKVFLYDFKKNEEVLNVISFKTYNTSRNIAVVNVENKYGVIEIQDDGFEYLIRPSYDKISMVNSTLLYLAAQDKDKLYILDIDGKKLSNNITSLVKSVGKDYIVGSLKNTYNLYDYNNKEVLSDYEYIGLYDEVIVLIKNKRLYLMDYSLNKLMEDGIRLENTNYVKEYVYDDNNKLIETKKAFDINVGSESIVVNNGSDEKEINLYEGAVSSNLSYVSYYDGKYYFYGDVEKNELLGTYTCTNKNVIKSSEDGLSSCYLYSSEDGISGIYNNQYVFIVDNSIINLYDIKAKKVKATYNSIDITGDKEINSNVKLIYTSSSYVIVSPSNGNNKGYYGVIEINSEKVQNKVSFNYKEIVFKNNYYVMKNKDDGYSIYDNKFNKVSNEFVKIDTFDNYYIGYSSKTFNIYNYSSTLGILENDVACDNCEVTVTYKDGYSVKVNDKIFEYDKKGKLILPTQNDSKVGDNQ